MQVGRREFLVTAAAAAQTRGRLRCAFLGMAHSHAEGKAAVIRESAEWELVAFAERDDAIAAPFVKAGLRRASREEILRDASIPVIVVESEVKAHAPDAQAALEAGKHVHVEKPAAYTGAAMRSLVETARRKKLLLQSGYMWRHNPGLNAMIEAAGKGWLGQVYLVRGMMNTLIGAERRPEWGLFAGGQMFEQGAHIIDAMVRLLGAPKTATGTLRKHGAFADDMKDNTVAVLEWPGTIGIVQASTLQANANAYRTFEIQGTKGTATLRPIEPPGLTMDLTEAAGPYRKGVQTVTMPAYRRYVGDFEALAAAARGERALPATLDQELAVQETILAAAGMK